MKRPAIGALVAATLLSACQPSGEPAPSPETGAAMGDPANNPDMTGLAAEVDADGNGEMSRAEWTAKGLPESSFNMFENGRGFVTLEDYQTNTAPPGIDMDGDGKVTVAEFVAFDQQMAAQMQAEGAPPPPPSGE
jgi:EF hand